MIYEVIQIISEEVQQFLNEQGLDGSEILIENVSSIDAPDKEHLSDKILLTLLSIREEPALKNFPNHRIANDSMIYRNVKVNLNLMLLFAANRAFYTQSLRDISKIIEFFQSKRLFIPANTIFDRNANTMNDIVNFRFTMELLTPSFEELNYIWGTLGGKQIPSALYKLSVIQIERDLDQTAGSLIHEISTFIKKK